VLTSTDEFAVVGGPPEFIEVLEAHLNLEEPVLECIDAYLDEYRTWRRNIDGFLELIQHVYGPGTGLNLLTKAGLIH